MRSAPPSAVARWRSIAGDDSAEIGIAIGRFLHGELQGGGVQLPHAARSAAGHRAHYQQRLSPFRDTRRQHDIR